MLRFFRTIRQRLLTKNRFSRYLLYAIGEILLVMIGILMALEVNTWENKRQNASLRQEYLQSLITELRADYESWELVKKKNDTVIDIVQKIIHNLQSNDPEITGWEASRMLLRTMESLPVTSQNSTYADLVSTGNMALIKPFELRQNLIRHYKSIEQFLEHSQREYDYVWNQLHPFFNNHGYYDWQAGIVKSGLDSESNPFPSPLKEMVGSRAYKALENNINFRRVTLMSQNGILDRVLHSTEILIQQIDKELKPE